ncbi:MAG: PAS domain-containing protein [Nitrospira sp.]
MKIVHPYHEADRASVRSTLLGFLTVSTVLVTFVIDVGLPDGIAAWVPYCLAIVLALQWKGASAIFPVTAIALVLMVLGQYVGPLGDREADLTNRAIGAVTITCLALVCWYIDWMRKRLVRSRDAIASSQRRLRSFVNSVNRAGIVLSDLRGRITEWSQGAQLLTGYRSEEMVGKLLYRAFPGKASSVARWAQVFQKVRRKTKVVREEAYQCRDGSWCWLHIVVKPLRNRFGRLHGYSLVMHDLTKTTPSTIQPSCDSRSVSPILNNGLNGILYRCQFEPLRTLDYVDPRIVRLIGDSGDGFPPLHSQPLGEWIHPLDRDRVWNAIEEAVRARRPYLLVYRLATVAGTEKWIWDEGEAAMNDNGTIIGLEGVLAEMK